MAESCVYVPNVGERTFFDLKAKYGYDLAWQILQRGLNDQFLADHKEILEIGPDGVPTAASLMKTDYMKNLVGSQGLKNAEQNKYVPVEDSADNYVALLEQAKNFNDKSPLNDRLVAVVDRDEDDDSMLKVKIVEKSDMAKQVFNEQYSAMKLTQKLVDMFGNIGITAGRLSSVERNAGRVGVIRFDTLKKIGEDIIDTISVADNMEGARALSEEFSHLIIRMFYNEPLVQRSLAALTGDTEALRTILGGEYEDTVSYHNGDMSLVAEEALGQLLKKNLIKQESDMEPLAKRSLFRRLIDFIRNIFSRYSVSDVRNALNEADENMHKLSKEVLSGERSLSEDRLRSIDTDIELNALSDRVQRNIDILKEARLTESKRPYITRDVDTKHIREVLAGLGFYIDKEDNPAKTVEGLLVYANEALKTLKSFDAQFNSLDRLSPQEQMTFLRQVRQYIQSYGTFIEAMSEATLDENSLNSEELEEHENMAKMSFTVGGSEVNIEGIIPQLRDLSEKLKTRFGKEAMPRFAAYLERFVQTDDGKIPLANGKRVSVLDLLKEAESDISFFDRWLDGGNESADPIMRLTDEAVKNVRDKVNARSIDFAKRVQQLMLKAEKYGITNFEWMFEKDSTGKKTGHYVSPYSVSSFEAAYTREKKRLDLLYGINPEDPTQRRNKLHDLLMWERIYGTYEDGRLLPNPDKWHSTQYDDLSENQKEILGEFLDLKAELDSYYPDQATFAVKAIQMRKRSFQRMLDSLSSPRKFIENVKQNVVEELFITTSDEGEYGVASDTIDFTGRHHMVLPTMYTRNLENPEELSTDVFGTLMAYSYAAINYDEMDKVVDTLEVGRTLVNDFRKVTETSGKKKIRERVNRFSDKNHRKFVYLSDTSYMVQQFNDYLDSKVYSRYLKDSGAFDVFGKQTNANKLTSVLLKYSSIAQLGLNWLANTANILTGVSMQNIEAACGEYFKASELFKADVEYMKHMKDFLPELGARIKKSKIALFDELINYKGNFRNNTKVSQKRNILDRMFGAGLLFFGQDAGDHWMYNRTAIAMALRTKVKLPGSNQAIPLWEALKIRDKFEDNSDIKEMYLPEGTTDENGNIFNIHKWGREVLRLNQTLFGVYNEEDSSAANRVAGGRLLLQYKKWMKPQFNKRFQKKQYDITLDNEIEGYYRTLYRISKELLRGGFQWQAMKESLSDTDKKNLWRCVTELAQLFGVWALANLVNWPDDKDRTWAVKMAEYSAQRLTHELGNLAPTPMMLTEMSKTFESPIASASAVKNFSVFVSSLCSPWSDWNDELQSGTYKGHSTLYKNFMKAPFPGVAQYRMLDRFMNDLDTGIAYYIRSR